MHCENSLTFSLNCETAFQTRRSAGGCLRQKLYVVSVITIPTNISKQMQEREREKERTQIDDNTTSENIEHDSLGDRLGSMIN